MLLMLLAIFSLISVRSLASSELDSQISRGTSRVCLCFGSGNIVLNRYTYGDMVDDMDSIKSTYRYKINFIQGSVS